MGCGKHLYQNLKLFQLDHTPIPSLRTFVNKKVGDRAHYVITFKVVSLVFSISNYFINKNFQGSNLSVEKNTYLVLSNFL